MNHQTIQRWALSIPLFLAVFSGRAASAAEDWPQFRGPTGQGISTATNVPTKWSATQNVAWKVEIPGRGWSSPSLVDGKLYLTTATGGGGKNVPVVLWAFCLDAATGKVLWESELFHPDTTLSKQMHGKNSPASPTPIVAGDRVYVHFGPMGTAALDLAGKVVWRQTDIKFAPVHGNGGSPALVGDSLIFSCDGLTSPFIAALDAKTGQLKWKTPRNSTASKTFSFSTPLAIDVNGVTQVISPASGFVGAYNPENGKELWRVRYGEGYSLIPRPVFADGIIYVSSGFNVPTVYAIRAQGATADATSKNVVYTMNKGGPQTPSLLVAGDELYMVEDKGLATCADAKTGKVHWTHRLAGGYSASPLYAEGRVYFQNEEGLGSIVKASKTFEPVAENDLGERSLSSYAVTDGTLLIRTERHLWRIGAGEGKK